MGKLAFNSYMLVPRSKELWIFTRKNRASNYFETGVLWLVFEETL